MVNGTFLIRIVWPMGSASPNRLVTGVLPSTATLFAESMSCCENSAPISHGEIANRQIVGSNSVDVRRPVIVSVNHLGSASHQGCRKGNVRALRHKFPCIRFR